MPLNPNIPLSAIGMVSPLELAKAQGVGMELQDRQMLRDALSNPGNFDAATGRLTSAGLQGIIRASPGVGMKLAEMETQRQLHEAQRNLAIAHTASTLSEDQARKMQILRDADGRAWSAYDNARQNGATEEVARQRGQEVTDSEFMTLSGTGLFPGLQRQTFDPKLSEANIRTAKDVLAERERIRAENAKHMETKPSILMQSTGPNTEQPMIV